MRRDREDRKGEKKTGRKESRRKRKSWGETGREVKEGEESGIQS